MEIYVKQVTSWSRALDAARMTVGKEPLHKEPSDEWKDRILMAEHSPIRLVEYDIYLKDIPSFVATHLVRHHMGCEKFVVTNREDRRNINPEEVNRLTPVDMMMTCNAQALINISRKRLCNCASKETREVWKAVKDAIAEIDPIMAKHMVRECVYRGFCPEMKPCGFADTNKHMEEMIEYFNGKQNDEIDLLLSKPDLDTFDWDRQRRLSGKVRVAFNKCKTSRKRNGLLRMFCECQAFYNIYNKETKITNKKHHGFIIGNIVNGGYAVICDDAKLRFVKESDVVYL